MRLLLANIATGQLRHSVGTHKKLEGLSPRPPPYVASIYAHVAAEGSTIFKCVIHDFHMPSILSSSFVVCIGTYEYLYLLA